MSGVDTAYINRTLGSLHNDLGYLLDVGVITDAIYEDISAKIPRRYKAPANGENTSSNDTNLIPPASVQLPQASGGRRVPLPPTNATSPVPLAPPAYNGIGHAEALYDFSGTDANDLSFKFGDKITIIQYINDDWWKGSCQGREGIFPSNYVKQLSDTHLEQIPYQQAQQYPALPANQYNSQQYQPVQYAYPPPQTSQQVSYAQSGVPATQQQQQQQPVAVVKDKTNGKLHAIGGKLGNAAIFGAGATIGSNLVNSIF